MKLATPIVALSLLGLAACAEPFAYEQDQYPQAERAPERTTIYDVASTTDGFGILAAAVDATGLDAALDGKRQLTVFAPTDEAFLDLLDELDLEAEELLADEELVTTVLLYHVAPGSRYAADVLESDRIRTLEGSFAWISADESGAYIDDARIIATDIETDNGVIHVIDRVILPF